MVSTQILQAADLCNVIGKALIKLLFMVYGNVDHLLSKHITLKDIDGKIQVIAIC